MKNYVKLNYNYNIRPDEEKKERNTSEKNKYFYSTIQLNDFINDLSKKKSSNIKICDSSKNKERNNIHKSSVNKYSPANSKYTKIDSKKKDYKSYIIETDINQRKVHSYYNIKINLKEKNSKQLNDNDSTNKSCNKLYSSKGKNNNSQITYNFLKLNNNLFKSQLNENKKHILNIPHNKINKKKNLNSYYYKEYNLKKNNDDNKNRISNNNSKLYENIYVKKRKTKINISSIKQECRSYRNNDEEINIQNPFKIKKDYLKNIYNNNNTEVLKSYKLNLRSSHLLFHKKLKNNNTINVIYNSKKDSKYNYNISKDKSSSKLSERNSNLNRNMINKKSNHSFYNSNYGSINSKNKNLNNCRNPLEEKKTNKIYNYSSDKKDNLYSKNYLTNQNRNRNDHSLKNSQIYPKVEKNIYNRSSNLNKEKTPQIDNRRIIRDNDILSKSCNKIQYQYSFNSHDYKNNFFLNIDNKGNYFANDANNLYNNSSLISRNSNLNQDKRTNIKCLNINEAKNDPNFYFGQNVRYRKTKKEYHDGRYEGIIINNKREIKGIMYYKNGSKYEGQWRNDKKHGKGVFISQNYNNPKLIGIKYEGEFNNDKIEGYGVGKYTSGDKYEGEWKNNKQYGRGILIYKEGGKYIGEWKNGKLNGNGIYYLKNGERFEGNFIDDKYNGYGKYYYNDGEFLEGIFKNDLPSGSCILHKIDGTTEEKDFD